MHALYVREQAEHLRSIGVVQFRIFFGFDYTFVFIDNYYPIID
jgi:hypothetical protein